MSEAPKIAKSSDSAAAGARPDVAPQDSGAYRVLARKYRPATFAELVGQEAMVRTLSNAFQSGRIAQAYMLSGVRGVGKTTTARILARALNYEPLEGGGGPTLDMPVLGRHCEAIIESRHIDVLEMDAASHNSVDDIRQINDAIRYTPVSARYKIYILDEVHMLSTAAFNALLKSLEEPPPHVKFIFATTEIRKVPVTVLSRCQRFDLRRVEGDVIARQLSEICEKEGVTAEPEALGIIARAAEGSVRDALSLLDQAIAHGQSDLKADEVRSQLGLADRARVTDLFESLLKGDIATALADFRELYDTGADPAVVIADLAEFTHLITRFKLVPSSADDRTLVESERKRGREFAEKFPIRVLSRTWQMLTKGLSEVQASEKAAQAAEMVLVRVAYAADLPTPDEALRTLRDTEGGAAPARESAPSGAPSGSRMAMTANGGGGTQAARRHEAAPQPESAPAPRMSAPAPAVHLAKFEDVVALAGEKRDLQTKLALEQFVRPVSIQEGRLEISLIEGAPHGIAHSLSAKLLEWTGKRWLVVLSPQPGGPTIKETQEASQNALAQDVRKHPLVEAVLQRFPGSEIVAVRRRDDAPAAIDPDAADFAMPDMPPDPPDDDRFD
jgi:DNA polymerase III subunit gamma/tau